MMLFQQKKEIPEKQKRKTVVRHSVLGIAGAAVVLYVTGHVIRGIAAYHDLSTGGWGFAVAAIVFCLYLAAVVPLIVSFIRRSQQRKADFDESEMQVQTMRLQKTQEQLNALQSQINPHFLYNTLDTIRGLAIEKEDYEVSDIVGTLSSMFRYSMDFKSTMISISNELAQVDRYMKVVHMRFPGKCKCEYIYDCDPIDLNRVLVPKFTIQPLVENAVRHGLKNCVSDGLVTVRFSETEDCMLITVSDNGEGMDDTYVAMLNRLLSQPASDFGEVPVSDLGIALPSVNTRIKLHCGEEYGLHVASTPGLGTDVEIRTPL